MDLQMQREEEKKREEWSRAKVEVDVPRLGKKAEVSIATSGDFVMVTATVTDLAPGRSLAEGEDLAKEIGATVAALLSRAAA